MNSNRAKRKLQNREKINKCIKLQLKGTFNESPTWGSHIWHGDFVSGIELLIEMWLILEPCCLWLPNTCRTPINRWTGRVWAPTSRRVHLPPKVDGKLSRQSMGKSIMHRQPNYSPQLLIRCLFIIMPHQTRCAAYGYFYTEKAAFNGISKIYLKYISLADTAEKFRKVGAKKCTKITHLNGLSS